MALLKTCDMSDSSGAHTAGPFIGTARITWLIEGKPMTSFSDKISRRAWVLGAAGAAIASPFIARSPASAASIPNIRYATGGGIGPNEMETIIFLKESSLAERAEELRAVLHSGDDLHAGHA